MFLKKRFFDGGQIEIGALPVVGGSSSDGNASGLFSTVTVSAANATLTISSTATAGLVTVAVISPSASAFSGGGGNYPFVTVNVDNPTGSVSGTASTSGTLASVSIHNAEASAQGDALTSALLAEVAVYAMLPTVMAGASVAGAFTADSLLAGIGSDAIGNTAIAGSLDSSGRVEIGNAEALATGTANTIAGIGVGILTTSPSAFANGTANASVEFISVVIVHLDGSAEARNPPSLARSRIFSIVSATPSVRISTTNNAARNVVPIN